MRDDSGARCSRLHCPGRTDRVHPVDIVPSIGRDHQYPLLGMLTGFRKVFERFDMEQPSTRASAATFPTGCDLARGLR